MSDLYIGLMSGTSMDGIDACLIDLSNGTKLICTNKTELPRKVRNRLLALAQNEPTKNSACLIQLGELDAELGELFAAAAQTVLKLQSLKPEQIKAIGSHGQTLWHHPHGDFPFSLQLGDPARIAERTGITTVANFRQRDIAAGGQGAPLVPAFHAALFQVEHENRAILNIGGMANLTLLPAGRSLDEVSGFDTGPGNALLDIQSQRYLGTSCDMNGALAAAGHCNDALLEKLMSDQYFMLAPPKSTGREYFNAAWLEHHLRGAIYSPADIQATLVELTVRSAAQAILDNLPGCHRVLVCGGGAYNPQLMKRLAACLPEMIIESTATYGIDPDWIEAMAFAWLAHQTLEFCPGNLPRVTGARRQVILGAIHPAGAPRGSCD